VTRRNQTGQDGFSLIELTIALVVTMIVAGAIFGLLTAGNTAFRREPELADRQQNIRVAMDIIAQDIRRAGSGMPRFMQVFENGMDGTGPMGPHGENTDEVQMLSTTDCNVLPVCSSDGVNVVTRPLLSNCHNLPNVVFLVDTACPTEDDDCRGFYWAEPPGATSTASCGGTGGSNGHVNLPPGQSEVNVNNPAGGPGFNPNFMGMGAVARYRIHVDADGVPNLERSATGGVDRNGRPWEVIARGIEDLQVEYLNGSGVWQDEPGVVNCASCPSPTQADYDTIVQRVRIRLSARALAPNLQGETVSASGSRAVRGELISEFAPNQATITIAQMNREL
jgi:type II secretory pathway pseudopilin PulG